MSRAAGVGLQHEFYRDVGFRPGNYGFSVTIVTP